MPQSIHARNTEAMAEEVRRREELEREKNKFKRLKRLSVDQQVPDGAENQMDTQDSSEFMRQSHDADQLKFVPVKPAPKEYFPSPVSRMHTVGPQVTPPSIIESFDGERDMLRVIDSVRRQPAGFFLYLTHAYSKNSNKYNFYNLK